MKITDEAKSMLNSIFTSEKYDCMKASLQKGCCGTSVAFTLSKLKPNDKPIDVNGIPVLMDDKTQDRATKITIKVEKGELVIHDDGASSCCC